MAWVDLRKKGSRADSKALRPPKFGFKCDTSDVLACECILPRHQHGKIELQGGLTLPEYNSTCGSWSVGASIHRNTAHAVREQGDFRVVPTPRDRVD